MEQLENWLLNVALGKFVAQGAVLIAAYVAGPVVQGIAAKAGVTLAIDPTKLQAELMLLATGLLKWFEARRAANPESPAIQTDASKPCATVSAAASVTASSVPTPAP